MINWLIQGICGKSKNSSLECSCCCCCWLLDSQSLNSEAHDSVSQPVKSIGWSTMECLGCFAGWSKEGVEECFIEQGVVVILCMYQLLPVATIKPDLLTLNKRVYNWKPRKCRRQNCHLATKKYISVSYIPNLILQPLVSSCLVD